MDAIRLLRTSGSPSDYELRPGRFPDARTDEVVYLSEQVFGCIEPALVRHFHGFNPYGPSVIRVSIWRRIIDDLEAMQRHVERAASVADLRVAGVGFAIPGLDIEFERAFRANADALGRLLSDLVEWLARTLERQEAVSVLGP